MVKEKKKNKSERITITLEGDFKEFIDLCSEKTTRNTTDFCRLNILNGFDLLLCYVRDDLSNLDYVLDSIERSVDSWKFKEKINSINSLNKLKGGEK